jgi:hypothetical protein
MPVGVLQLLAQVGQRLLAADRGQAFISGRLHTRPGPNRSKPEGGAKEKPDSNRVGLLAYPLSILDYYAATSSRADLVWNAE